MVEVLFGESEATFMKIAIENGAISADSEKIICLDLKLDIGNIKEDIDSDHRNKLMEYVSKGETIRIWYSNTPHDMCGFYYLCNLLKGFSNEILSVKLPDYIQVDDIVLSYENWGEVLPEKFDTFLKYEKKISQMEINLFSSKWEELVKDNSPLRAVVNGQLIGVPIDFYDYLIYKYIGDKPIKEVALIGEILATHLLGVEDWWYASRIQYMIENNKIKIVEDSHNEYLRVISI